MYTSEHIRVVVCERLCVAHFPMWMDAVCDAAGCHRFPCIFLGCFREIVITELNAGIPARWRSVTTTIYSGGGGIGRKVLAGEKLLCPPTNYIYYYHYYCYCLHIIIRVRFMGDTRRGITVVFGTVHTHIHSLACYSHCHSLCVLMCRCVFCLFYFRFYV